MVTFIIGTAVGLAVGTAIGLGLFVWWIDKAIRR